MKKKQKQPRPYNFGFTRLKNPIVDSGLFSIEREKGLIIYSIATSPNYSEGRLDNLITFNTQYVWQMWASSLTVRYKPTSPMMYELAFGLARTLFIRP